MLVVLSVVYLGVELDVPDEHPPVILDTAMKGSFELRTLISMPMPQLVLPMTPYWIVLSCDVTCPLFVVQGVV